MKSGLQDVRRGGLSQCSERVFHVGRKRSFELQRSAADRMAERQPERMQRLPGDQDFVPPLNFGRPA